MPVTVNFNSETENPRNWTPDVVRVLFGLELVLFFLMMNRVSSEEDEENSDNDEEEEEEEMEEMEEMEEEDPSKRKQRKAERKIRNKLKRKKRAEKAIVLTKKLVDLDRERSPSDLQCFYKPVKSLRRVLSKKKPPIQEVIDNGGVEVLMKLFNESSDNEGKFTFQLAWALTNLLSGDKKQCKYLVAKGAIESFNTKMRTTKVMDTKEQCIWALANIAGDNTKDRDRLLQMDFVHFLVGMIFETSSDCVALINICVWALSNCIRGNPAPSLEYVTQSVPAVLHVLCGEASFSVDAVSDAIFAAELAAKVDLSLVMEPLIPLLGELLEYNDYNIVKSACEILQLIAEDSKHCSKLVRQEIVEQCLDLIVNEKIEHLGPDVALCSMCWGNEADIQAILDSPHLFEAIADNLPHTFFQVAILLLGMNKEQLREAISRLPWSMEMFPTMMLYKAHGYHKAVYCEVVKSIRNHGLISAEEEESMLEKAQEGDEKKVRLYTPSFLYTKNCLLRRPRLRNCFGEMLDLGMLPQNTGTIQNADFVKLFFVDLGLEVPTSFLEKLVEASRMPMKLRYVPKVKSKDGEASYMFFSTVDMLVHLYAVKGCEIPKSVVPVMREYLKEFSTFLTRHSLPLMSKRTKKTILTFLMCAKRIVSHVRIPKDIVIMIFSNITKPTNFATYKKKKKKGKKHIKG